MEIGIEQSEFKGKPVLALSMKYDNGFSKRISYGQTNWQAIVDNIETVKQWLEHQKGGQDGN